MSKVRMYQQGKSYQTMWPELQYEKVGDVWRFTNEGHVVGPQYPTKTLLLADMRRYAKEAWSLE
jgi:hypothetical protein